MSRKRKVGKGGKIALCVSGAMVAGGVAFTMAGTGHASAACDGLATALSNNQKFIAAQRAAPDAQSAARIANREAVIKQIGVQQKEAGCSGAGAGSDGGAAAGAGGGDASAGASAPGSAEPPASSASAPPPASSDPAQPAGDVVCPGSTVTLSGEGGAPAASSDEFPVGTQLKVTNLDNDKSTTVSVTSTSGSCALLNNAAFEQVREEGKFLIRNARIERVS
ncbi:hypothetical protein [Streptomyces sp. NPDC101393]|uniref:hypothetical protein n=1 Tax=Streptomyces sp. NPDC101393 TaxID=3366141 RepID=UPI0037FFD5F6